MRKILILIISVVLPFIVDAQGRGGGMGGYQGKSQGIGVVKGKIKDAQSGQPIEFATVAIYKASDSTMVSGVITDTKGGFIFENLPYGKFFIKINFIGYRPKRLTSVNITPQKQVLDIGSVNFNPTTTKLKEVNIVADKPLIEYKLDRKIVNVENNITTTGGTAVDVLQQIPSVDVDFNGNISLRGNSNVTILVDGKQSLLTQDQLQEIPASQIANIEVITNPSAKYNPDGMAGIININMKTQDDKGFNGIATINAGTGNKYTGPFTVDKYNGSVNFNYKVKKFNYFGSYDGRTDLNVGSGYMNRSTSLIPTLPLTSLTESDKYYRSQRSNNIKLGTEYSFDKYNSLKITVMERNPINTSSSLSSIDVEGFNPVPETLPDVYVDKDNLKSNNPIPKSLPPAHINNNYLGDDYLPFIHKNQYFYDSYTNTGNSNAYGLGESLNLNYRKKYDKKDKLLTADAIFNVNNRNSPQNNNWLYYNDNRIVMDSLKGQTTISNNNSTTLQTDYVNPLGEHSKLEAGAQAIIKHTDNNYTYSNWNPELNNYIDDPLEDNHFIYNMQVYAGYGTYSTEFAFLNSSGNDIATPNSIQVGLRAEEAFTQSIQRTMNENFNYDYFQLYPSAFLTRKLDETQSIQLSYSRRVNRPNQFSLNPFVNRSNPNNITFGNPDLRPEYINSIELGYLKYIQKKNTISADLFYKGINNVIKNLVSVVNSTQTETTYANLSTGVSYGAELIGDVQIIKGWRASLSGSYFKTIINGNNLTTSLSNQNYSWTSKLNTLINLPDKFGIQITGNYRGPLVTAQGHTEATYFVDGALKKDIMKQKATITLRLSDIFNTRKFINVIDETEPYYLSSTTERRRESRILYLSFTYKINNEAQKYGRGKKKDQKDQNDLKDQIDEENIEEMQ